jgi:hypothetical protein
MTQNKDTTSPISINDLSIQDFENLAKQLNEKRNSTFYGLNQSRQDTEYTKEEILQMRANNVGNLYKSPTDVVSSYGCTWENGKVGYFIPFDHKPLNGDFLPAQFGGGQKDGKGLRFVQSHKNHNEVFLMSQSSVIILSGFGEYVLGHWGKDLNQLFNEYTKLKLNKLAEKWKKEHFPVKMDLLTKLNLLKDLKEAEVMKLNEAIISDYITTADNEKLNQCMKEYMDWLDKCVQIENNKGEIEYLKNLQSGTITCGNGWANGKSGQFNDFDNNYQYRFCETDENGYHYLLNEKKKKKLPVLACGFVAWLIKHWGTDTQTIYSGYLQARLDQYKSSHKNDADVLKRDLDSEFFEQYNSQEEKFVLQSEAIFDFISEKEVNKIKEYIQYYFEYFEGLTNSLKMDDYNKESEILKCTLPNIKQIYSVLKKYPVESSDFSPLAMINDLRRIEQYHESKPDECIAFIADKYKMKWAESTRFIECLKLILDAQSDFMFLLNNQTFMILLNENVKVDFAMNLNILLDENMENSNLSSTNKPKQTIFDVESLSEHSNNFKFKGNEILIGKIHEHCNNDIFICTENEFVSYVQSANFASLKIKIKSKVKLLIFLLSKQMGSDWYSETAKSLSLQKSECSGANVSDEKWKKEIKRIIPQ